LIDSGRLVRISAFLLVAVPFALVVDERITVSIDTYCNKHGNEAFGFFVLQLMFLLPLGLILLIFSALKKI
jgi:hypothetical protein